MHFCHEKEKIQLNYIDFISSKRFIKVIAQLELLFWGFVIYQRIKLVQAIFRIEKGLREIITLHDYEFGWGFVFLFLLIVSSVLTFKIQKIPWLIKQATLIAVFITLGFKMVYVGVVVVLLILYYSINKVAAQFGIEKHNRKKYYAIVAVIVLILMLAYIFFDLITY